MNTLVPWDPFSLGGRTLIDRVHCRLHQPLGHRSLQRNPRCSIYDDVRWIYLLSAEETASVESEFGWNWIDVMGLVCHKISEMLSLVGYLKSHTLKHPSSALSYILKYNPDAIRLVDTPFQEITFTSHSWALMRIYDLFLLPTRVSQTCTVPSMEHEAKANASTGDHWISSTDYPWW